MNVSRISLFAVVCLFFASCDKGDPPMEVTLPTNLNTVVSTDEREVDIAASADNVNFFTFTFFEDGDSTSVESADGTETFTFATGGTHSIRTRAHATYDNFIEKNENVAVAIDTPWTGGVPTTGYSTPNSYPGYTLVWSDEFNGTSLSSDWVHEIGTGDWGWGNNELQYYREENVEVANGYLTITAKEENYNGSNYTSSRIITKGNQSFEKGRIDIRAALPFGKGIWPALWMLGDNISSVSWPACGEIDIMEMVGGTGSDDRTVHGTIHWDDNGHASYGGSNSLSSGLYAEEWHVFSIVWDDTAIRWYRDDIEYQSADITPAGLSEFHENFFFIFNVAVGGNWPGSPDGSTVFPQTMAVDYVRVFQ